MLGTAKTDTFCSQLNSLLSVRRCVCISTYFQSSVLVCPCHDTSELTSDGSVYCRDDAVIDVSCGSIQRKCISFVEFFSTQCKFLICFVHYDVAASRYTAGTHSTCNNGSVRSHTATNCQDTLCRFHTGDIFRRGLQTNQDNFLSSFCPLYSVICCKYDLTACSSRRSAKSLSDRRSLLQCLCIKLRVKQGV